MAGAVRGRAVRGLLQFCAQREVVPAVPTSRSLLAGSGSCVGHRAFTAFSPTVAGISSSTPFALWPRRQLSTEAPASKADSPAETAAAQAPSATAAAAQPAQVSFSHSFLCRDDWCS